MKNEFGNVGFISRTEMTEGYLLRETKDGVVLEDYCDCEHTRVDVVAEFKGSCINVDADFRKCLSEAREYEGNANTKIWVDINPWKAAINQRVF